MSFTNLYYKRTAGTAKACYVCYKPTTTVLATINTVDFLYACPTHLTDPGFATQVKDENGTKSPAATVSAEEIAKIKAEWEEKQKKKLEKEKEREKEKDKEKDGDKDKDKEAKDTRKSTSASPSASSPTLPPTPSHERYILHRDFFSMRQMEHRRRRQTIAAKDVASRLPSVPRGDIS